MAFLGDEWELEKALAVSDGKTSRAAMGVVKSFMIGGIRSYLLPIDLVIVL